MGSGLFSRLTDVALTPTPTSPRRYQPPNYSPTGAGEGRRGAGGRSIAPASPPDARATPAAMTEALSLAMTIIPSFGALRCKFTHSQRRGQPPMIVLTQA